MYSSILLPLDGSAASDQAVPMALAVAERTGARIELAIVRAPGAPPYVLPETPPPDSDADRERRVPLREYVEEVSALLRGRVAEVNGVILEGEVGPSLIAHAEQMGASMVVMTTHGRGGLSRAWLGSVAERLVREIPIPVLMRRPFPEGEAGAESFAPGRMLVPLDGSPVAESIIDRAAALALPFGATAVLLQVVEPIIVRARMVTAPVVEVDEEDLASQAEAAEHYLNGVAERLRSSGVQSAPRIVAHDQTAKAILRAAQDVDADCIAMATHGYGGLRRLVVGSVADKVMRGAECPLLLYRPPRG